MNDIMLDLETMGVGTSPAIISIAAVQFDLLSGNTGSEFMMNVSLDSSVNAGLQIDASTVEFWMQQSDEARSRVMANGARLDVVLHEFAIWLQPLMTDSTRIWGNGIAADNVWLRSAYRALGQDAPWPHWADADVRTIVDIGKRVANVDFKTHAQFKGVRHDALDDCKHQIKYVSSTVRALL